MNAHKISLEWARIEPKRDVWNEDALSHYREMIKAMKSKGLKPIVALNHLTLPEWVLTPPKKFIKKLYQNWLPSPLRELPMGDPPKNNPFWKSLRGWENYETVESFTKYVKRVVENLKDEVDYWITLGEPITSVIGGGHLTGIYPPGFFWTEIAEATLHNLIEAHVQAYEVITNVDDVDADLDGITKKVGVSHFMVSVSPDKSSWLFGLSQKRNSQAAENFRYFINDYFLNAVIKGEEDLNYLETLKKSVRNNNKFVVKRNGKIKSIL